MDNVIAKIMDYQLNHPKGHSADYGAVHPCGWFFYNVRMQGIDKMVSVTTPGQQTPEIGLLSLRSDGIREADFRVKISGAKIRVFQKAFNFPMKAHTSGGKTNRLACACSKTG